MSGGIHAVNDANKKRCFITKALGHFRSLDHPFTSYLNNHINQVFTDKGHFSLNEPECLLESCPFCGFSLAYTNDMALKRRKDVYNLVKQKKRGWKAHLALLNNTPKKSRYVSTMCKVCKSIVLIELKTKSKNFAILNKISLPVTSSNAKLANGFINKFNEKIQRSKPQPSTIEKKPKKSNLLTPFLSMLEHI